MHTETLLVSIGGAPMPIIVSIRQNEPARVIFFVSRHSRAVVSRDILPELLKDPGRIPDHEFVVTPDEQDLGASTEALLREVPGALERLGGCEALWPSLVDYTGGTKTMSSALVWASSRYPCRFSYIGTPSSEGRTKDGLGIVIDGRERRFLRENPWDRVAWMEVREALILFNRAQYANAVELFQRTLEKVTDRSVLRLFRVLLEIFQAFQAWDEFDHKQARHLLAKNLKGLLDLAETPQVHIPGLKPFARQVAELFEIIDLIPPGKLSREICYDLMANAQRRAGMELKYEDATARLYAAVEKYLKYELSNRYRIDNSNADPLLLPESHRGEYLQRYQTGSRIQFGLRPTLELLRAFGDDIGNRFTPQEEERFHSRLKRRNDSILGHGIEPMTRKDFEVLFQDALRLMKLEQESLTLFPQFPL